jgi:hypothetical protein
MKTLAHRSSSPYWGDARRPHGQEFEDGERPDGGGGQRKHQIGVFAALPDPQEEIDQRERQTRGAHHGPGDVDPTHPGNPIGVARSLAARPAMG